MPKAFDLKEWRRVKRLKQKDVAAMCQVSIKTVSNWEAGTYAMPHDIEHKLGGALDPSKLTEEELNRLDPPVTWFSHGQEHPEWFEHYRAKEYTRTHEHPGCGVRGRIRLSELPALIEAKRLRDAQALGLPSLADALEHGTNSDAHALMEAKRRRDLGQT